MERGSIDLERDCGVWVVTLRGEHDLATAHRLRNALARSFSGGTAVIVDLSEVAFIDSTILHVLVTARRERYPIALVAPGDGAAKRLFDLVRLPDAIPTYRTRAEALARLGAAEREMERATRR